MAVVVTPPLHDARWLRYSAKPRVPALVVCDKLVWQPLHLLADGNPARIEGGRARRFGQHCWRLAGRGRERYKAGGWDRGGGGGLDRRPSKRQRQREVFGDLEETEKVVLESLRAQAWGCRWQQLFDDRRDDYDETPYWQRRLPSSIPGWLRMLGLVAVGTHQGEVIALIPAEMRAALSRWLGQ